MKEAALLGRRVWLFAAAAGLLLVLLVWRLILGAMGTTSFTAEVIPDREDRLEDGTPYTPATQSFTRGHHWLNSVSQVRVRQRGDGRADLSLLGGGDETWFVLKNIQLGDLVPRLYYEPKSPPDEFDAFNLMLAEYSRNGSGVPTSEPGADLPHFETHLTEGRAWSLRGDFDFVPNGDIRPLRFSVINNCLEPGLWEFAATDRAGEIYHSWFQLPTENYYRLVADLNAVEEPFARRALTWTTDPVPLDLERLTVEVESLGKVAAGLCEDSAVGYSSQDSRRKISKQFAMIPEGEQLRTPKRRSELTAGEVHFADFVPPGRYSATSRKKFNLEFLARPSHARVAKVEPLTSYNQGPRASSSEAYELGYLQIELNLGDYDIILGNLPVRQLAPQEDFVIYGFGVGVAPPDELIERRALRLEKGPAPSFCYLTRRQGERRMVLNSHAFGVEQVYIRTYSMQPKPYWEITIASFERIIDLVAYRVEIPEQLHGRLRAVAGNYTSPAYLTYRDDQIR